MITSTLFLCFQGTTYAMDVTLRWDANSEPDFAGYWVYYYKAGSSGGGVLANYSCTGADEGSSPIDVPLAQDENPDPDAVRFTVHGLGDDQIYYFVVTAYDT